MWSPSNPIENSLVWGKVAGCAQQCSAGGPQRSHSPRRLLRPMCFATVGLVGDRLQQALAVRRLKVTRI